MKEDLLNSMFVDFYLHSSTRLYHSLTECLYENAEEQARYIYLHALSASFDFL